MEKKKLKYLVKSVKGLRKLIGTKELLNVFKLQSNKIHNYTWNPWADAAFVYT